MHVVCVCMHAHVHFIGRALPFYRPPILHPTSLGGVCTMAESSKPRPLLRGSSKIAITVKHMKRDQGDRRKSRQTLVGTDALKDKQVTPSVLKATSMHVCKCIFVLVYIAKTKGREGSQESHIGCTSPAYIRCHCNKVRHGRHCSGGFHARRHSSLFNFNKCDLLLPMSSLHL